VDELGKDGQRREKDLLESVRGKIASQRQDHLSKYEAAFWGAGGLEGFGRQGRADPALAVASTSTKTRKSDRDVIDVRSSVSGRHTRGTPIPPATFDAPSATTANCLNAIRRKSLYTVDEAAFP